MFGVEHRRAPLPAHQTPRGQQAPEPAARPPNGSAAGPGARVDGGVYGAAPRAWTDAIRAALEDDEPGVRSAAAATIYARWAEFLPHLERVTADPANDPEVHETAAAVIEAIRG